MFQRIINVLLLLLLVLLLTPLPIQGQVDASTALLKGVVFDPLAAAVPGATVTVTSLDRGISQSVATGEDGAYHISLLPPGTYRIEVAMEGFEKSVANAVQLSVGASVIYDMHLVIGSVKDVLQVTAEAPLIETEKTQQANTLGTREIDSLPNLSRNFTDSVFTLPGVSSSDAPRAQNPGYTGFLTSGFSIGGSNGRNNLVTIDGGENEFGSGQLRTANISVESVQEFQVNRNAFAAEFGFTAGTAVNVVTKSGANRFNGSAYAFFRDQYTSARSYFDRTSSRPYDQNFSPGGTLGGPILRDKLFFFTSYEYRRLNTPRLRTYLNTPEAQGLNANSAQGDYVNQLANSGDPTLEGMAGFFRKALVPMNFPNVTKLLSANDGIFSDVNKNQDWVTRADYQPGSKDTLTFRFSIERWDYTNIGGNNLYAPSTGSFTSFRDYAILGTWNRVISPMLVNQLRVQVVPHNSADTPPVTPGTTELSIGDLGVFNQSYQYPYHSHQQRYQFEDNLTWMKGSHTLKLGASYRPVNYTVENDLWFGGEFDFYEGAIPLIALLPTASQLPLAIFNLQHGYPQTGPAATNLSALQSFAVGIPVTYRQGFNNPVWSDWAHYLGAFAQDSWKVSQRFTVNYGARLDFDAEPAPIPHNVYFSPRLGIAWDPHGDQKTVIRAGGGIFVSPVYFQVPYLVNLLNDSGKYINQVFRAVNSPGVNSAIVYGFGVQQGKLPFGQLTEAGLKALGIAVGPGAPGQVIFNLAPNYKNNYSIQASLSVARQLTHSVSMELGYQMYKGVHIPVDQETNYRETGQIDPVWGPRYTPINPLIIQSNTYSSIGNSTYNGLTASLIKRYTRNFQAQVNYTFSKAIDDNVDFNSQFASFTPTRLNLDRALSAYNIKHNFVANAVYNTSFKAGSGEPFWSRMFADIGFSPILRMHSGLPFTIRVPGAANGTLGHSLYARPWYLSRDTGIGPDFYDLDARLSKAFYINRDKGVRVDFIVEGTNLLNHTNFSSVNDQFSPNDPFLMTGPFNVKGNKNISPASPLGFTSAFPGRQIQFGLKLIW